MRPVTAWILLFLFPLAGCSKLGTEPPNTDWKTYRSQNHQFSLESPFPLEFKERTVQSPEGISLDLTEAEFKVMKPTPWQFFQDTVRNHFTKELRLRVFTLQAKAARLQPGGAWNTGTLLKKHEEEVRKVYEEKGKDFEFKTTALECSGLPAEQLEGSFTFRANLLAQPKLHVSLLAAARGNELWKVSLLYGESEDHAKIKERIFKSIKIGEAQP